MKTDICVVIVTYNRCQYLNKLVNAVLNQNVAITKLVIIDNHSTDDTQNMLVRNGLTREIVNDEDVGVNLYRGTEIYCVRSGANSGGSGGFHDGIEFAHLLGCQYIWVMDDDVLPAYDCLEKLLEQMTPERRICIPNRTGNGFVDSAVLRVNLDNPFLYTVRMRKTAIAANELTEEVTRVEDMPFEGPLIDSTLVDEIGLPKKDLFIIYDDSEYCMRALPRTSLGFVKSAHLYKQIIPTVDHAQPMNWKHYYGYRNQYWFDRSYGKNVATRIMRPLLSRFDLTLRSIVRGKWSNFRVLSRAYADGTRGRLGKTVEPGCQV